MLIPLASADFEVIIQRLLVELERKYREHLLYVAAYGSLARGAETPFSDVDLVAILDEGTPQSLSWLYGTTPVDVQILPVEKVRERILRVDGFWPHEVGSLLAHKVYLDRGDVAPKLRRWHDQALEEAESWMEPHSGFYEYMGKMERGWEERNAEVMRRAAWEIFFMSCMDLALLNKQFYVDHMRMTEQIEEFDIVPEGFLDHAMDLFHGDLRRVHEAAQSMFRIHLDLARKFGYEKTPIGHVEEIVLE